MCLNELSEKIYKANIEKGFYEDNKELISFLENQHSPSYLVEVAKKAILGQRLALIVSEASEALEANRKEKNCGTLAETYFKASIGNELFKENFEKKIKDTLEDEVSDILIRVLDFCGAYKINIDFHVKQKLRYNSLRPYKHGKKY